MQLAGKRFRWMILSFLATLALVGCTNREPGNTTCLAGGNDCGGISTPVPQNNSNTETPVSMQSPLRCSAYASPTQVDVGQTATIQVTTSGSRGTISVRDLSGTTLATGATNASFYKQYDSARAGQIVQETIMVQDAYNQYTYCSYQVQVKAIQDPTTPPSANLACDITASPTVSNVGSTTEFYVTARNNERAASFTQFYGSSEWLLSDSYIQTLSSNQMKVRLIYQYAGSKRVSVRVNADGESALCTLTVTAQGTMPNPNPPNPNPPTPSLACDLRINPLGVDKFPMIESWASSPSIAGSLTSVRAQASGGQSPYSIHNLEVTPPVVAAVYPAPVFAVDYFSSLSSESMKRVVRMRTAGEWVVRATVRDAMGATVQCISNYMVEANSTWAVSQLGGITTSTSKVKVYSGVSGAVLEDFSANSGSVGAAIAMGDFNADAKSDYATIESTAGIDTVKIFRATNTAWYSGKPAPSVMWTGYAGLPADGSERRIAAGDFDADGVSDFAVSNGCTGTATVNPRIRVYNGFTKALMTELVPSNLANQPVRVSALAAGDINGDGYSDLAYMSCDGSLVISYSGLSLRTQSAYPTIMTSLPLGAMAGSELAGLSVSDMNQDGKADWIIVWQQNGSAWVRVLNSINVATIASFYTQSGWQRFRAANADINGDGTPEILLSSSSQGTKVPQLAILDGAMSRASNSAQVSFTTNPFAGWYGSLGVAGGTGGY